LRPFLLATPWRRRIVRAVAVIPVGFITPCQQVQPGRKQPACAICKDAMKRCSYCGKEHDDIVTACTVDGQALVPMSSPPILTGPSDQSPALWNPNAAACWSLLFSPVFGAYIHARNAEALGRAEEAKANRVWFYLSIAYLAVVFVTSSISVIPTGVFRVAGLGLLLGWYFSLGKKQIKYVKDAWGEGYERKPWTKPLMIGFGCLIGAFVVLSAVALAEELLRGSQ
jgi:hypothetical protein